MPRAVDIAGKRFGRLTAVSPVAGSALKKRAWMCTCECGNKHKVATDKLRSGHTKSCGCYERDNPSGLRHGMRHTRIYEIWKDMRKRCRNPKQKYYKNYGGRGIEVCPRWDLFENFYADMGEPPSPKHTIDRRNNDRGYSPNNCRWSLMVEQQRNRSNNRLITIDGITRCLAEWAEITKQPYSRVSARLYRGKTAKEAIFGATEAKGHTIRDSSRSEA